MIEYDSGGGDKIAINFHDIYTTLETKRKRNADRINL